MTHFITYVFLTFDFIFAQKLYLYDVIDYCKMKQLTKSLSKTLNVEIRYLEDSRSKKTKFKIIRCNLIKSRFIENSLTELKLLVIDFKDLLKLTNDSSKTCVIRYYFESENGFLTFCESLTVIIKNADG